MTDSTALGDKMKAREAPYRQLLPRPGEDPTTL
ncbi:hypothetical protein BX265_7558 [Streptomyces sp. TLI_235]|nr:hypothetical protein BX265_7558 [Streptomyces sp. TLI_235]